MSNDNVIEIRITGDSSSAQRAFGALESKLGALGKAFTLAAIAAAAFKLGDMVQAAINTADQLGKMSQRTGIAVDTLSQMAHAAALSDVSLKDFGHSIELLQKNINEAISGNSAALASFKSLGLSFQDLKTKSPDEVLLTLADTFSKSRDGAAKTAAAFELFGRAGTQMIPALNQGREGIERLMRQADSLGLTVDKKFAQEAERFNDSMKLVAQAATGGATQLASQLLPVLNTTFDAMADIFTTGESAIPWGKILTGAAVGIAIVFERLAGAVQAAYIVISGAFDGVGKLIGGLGAALETLIDTGSFSKAGQVMKEAFDDAWRSVTKTFEETVRVIDKTNEGTKKIWAVLDQANSKIDQIGAAGEKANKHALQFVSKDAAAKLEELHRRQTSFLDDLARREAQARGDKLATLDLEYAAQVEKMNQLQIAGQERVMAMSMLDRWYAEQRLNIETSMLEKLGVADEAYRERRRQLILEEAEHMREMGLSETQINAYVKDSMLQQEIDYLAAKAALIDEDFLTNQEKADAQLELDLLRLQQARERELITEAQYNAMEEQAHLKHQAALGDIWAQGQLKRRQFAQMTWNQQAQDVTNALMQMTASVAHHSSTMFAINKAASIANAIVNTYLAVSKALSAYPPPWSFAMAAIQLAAGMAQVSQIRSQNFSGQAHAGLDFVPREGTFLLDEGERVLSPTQNRDLTSFLQSESGGVTIGSVSINISVPDSQALKNMSQHDWADLIAERIIPAFNTLDRAGVRPNFVQRLSR